MKSLFVLSVLFFVANVNCSTYQTLSNMVPSSRSLPAPAPRNLPRLPPMPTAGLTHHQKRHLKEFVGWVAYFAEETPVLSNYTAKFTFDQDQLECINKATGYSTQAEYKDFAAMYLTQIFQRLCIGLAQRAGINDNQVCYALRSSLDVVDHGTETCATVHVTNAPSNVFQLSTSLITKILANDMYTSMFIKTNSQKLYAALKCTEN